MSGLCRGPASVCSQIRGTEISATAGEGHRSAALPWGSARGFGSLGAVACRREASCLSSIYFGGTPRGVWESYIHGSFLSHPSVSLPPAPAWCGPLIYCSIP